MTYTEVVGLQRVTRPTSPLKGTWDLQAASEEHKHLQLYQNDYIGNRKRTAPGWGKHIHPSLVPATKDTLPNMTRHHGDLQSYIYVSSPVVAHRVLCSAPAATTALI